MGRRIAKAFDDVADVIAKDIRTDVPLVHLVRQVDLPARIVTEAEYGRAKKVCEEMDAKEGRGPAGVAVVLARYLWADGRALPGPAERRVGELSRSRCTCCDWATWRLPPIRSSCSSTTACRFRPAARLAQTILIQLASPAGYAGYVPTPRAVQAGGYSAEVLVNMIGPEGGQVLVDRTVETINELWK